MTAIKCEYVEQHTGRVCGMWMCGVCGNSVDKVIVIAVVLYSVDK